jgi:hypothetical protein
MTPWSFISVLLLATALGVPGSAASSPDAGSDNGRSIQQLLVERVVWPVFMEPRKCRASLVASYFESWGLACENDIRKEMRTDD